MDATLTASVGKGSVGKGRFYPKQGNETPQGRVIIAPEGDWLSSPAPRSLVQATRSHKTEKLFIILVGSKATKEKCLAYVFLVHMTAMEPMFNL